MTCICNDENFETQKICLKCRDKFPFKPSINEREYYCEIK